MDIDYDCSRPIVTENDINELMTSGYLVREVAEHIEQGREKARRLRTGGTVLFGRTRRAEMPHMSAQVAGGRPIQSEINEVASAVPFIAETNDNERIWFEARRLTGVSRNFWIFPSLEP